MNLKNKKILITGATGGIGYSLIKKFSEYGSIILATGTNQEKLDELKHEFKEINIYLRGIIPLLGFQSTSVEYALSPRQSGETKYVYKKSLSLALDGITSFSLTPLRLIGVLGFFIAFFQS